jgi:hypothetical protein
MSRSIVEWALGWALVSVVVTAVGLFVSVALVRPSVPTVSEGEPRTEPRVLERLGRLRREANTSGGLPVAAG